MSATSFRGPIPCQSPEAPREKKVHIPLRLPARFWQPWPDSLPFPPGLCQPVGGHPSCHVYQSWAGCQSDRLTSQKATARLGNSRYNRGSQSHLFLLGLGQGSSLLGPGSWHTSSSQGGSCIPNTTRKQGMLMPSPLSSLLVPRTSLNLSGAHTAAHPPGCHPAYGCRHEAGTGTTTPRSLAFFSACSSYCTSLGTENRPEPNLIPLLTQRVHKRGRSFAWSEVGRQSPPSFTFICAP